MIPEDARVLHQSTQQLRTHWSGIIVTYVGYAILASVGIWSYFLKTYIDSLNSPSGPQPIFIGIAAALTSVLLGLWRLYTHYIDHRIAGLYPKFLEYENIMSVGKDRPTLTSGYLIEEVPTVRPILLADDLTPEQKLEGISSLVKLKRIGTRGHFWFDLCAFLAISGMLIFSEFALRHELHTVPAIASLCGIIVGYSIALFSFFYYQRDPSEKLIEEIKANLKEVSG